MTNTILPDTSLAAIVRNEIMNPAGGIVRFVQSVAPYVEEAVIVDTGSFDGTREALEELQGIYPNLRVLDHRFSGFSHARNFSLAQVKTEHALILDADEIITKKGYALLTKEIAAEPARAETRWFFDWECIGPIGPASEAHDTGTFTERLFPVRGAVFTHEIWEGISHERHLETQQTRTTIYQFVHNSEAGKEKRQRFYRPFEDALQRQDRARGIDNVFTRAWMQGLPSWKTYNPRRDRYA